MDPTEAQRKAALNPTATNIATPTGQGLFKGVGNEQMLYRMNPNGAFESFDLRNVGGIEGLKSKGIDWNGLQQYNIADLTQKMISDPTLSKLSYNEIKDLNQFTNGYLNTSVGTQNTTINNTPNQLASPEAIAAARATVPTPTQKTFNNGVEITPQSIQQGVASITPTGAQLPTTALQPGSTDTASVKALQDYLVKSGYMTQAQVNTGYGTYGPQTTAAVAAMQKALGIDNSSGPGYFGPKTIAALQAGNVTSPNTTPGGITATGLTGGGSTAINLGSASSSSSYNPGSIVAGADTVSKSIQDYINLLTPPQDALHDKYDKLLSDVEGLQADQGGRGAAQAAAEKAGGVGDLRQALSEVNSEILRKTAEYKALSTDQEGKPVTMSSIIGAQAQIQKVMASDIGLLQARALGLQGQLEAAQATADRAVDLKYADAKDALDLRMSQLQLIEGELTKSEKVRADAISLYLADKKDALAVKVANEKDKNSTLLNLLQKYPDAKISLTDTLEQAAAKVKSSQIFQQETRLVSGSGTGVATPPPVPDWFKAQQTAFRAVSSQGGTPTAQEIQSSWNTYLQSHPELTQPALGKLTPTQTQSLTQAGLGSADSASKSFFVNTEPAFQDQFIRTVSTQGLNLGTVSAAELQQLYNEWQAQKSGAIANPFAN